MWPFKPKSPKECVFKVGVKNIDGKVVVSFGGQSIAYLRLDPFNATALAHSLLQCVASTAPQPLARKPTKSTRRRKK